MNRNARLVIVGEAQGPREAELGPGACLVGPTGNRLAEWMAAVGLNKNDAYLTNVVWDRQPAAIDRVPRHEMESYIDQLHARLAQLEDPWLIVPLGNYALYALTGKGKVSWQQRDGRHERPGITSWRGSILSYTDRRGRSIKVIPTIHPAASFGTVEYEHISTRYDWPRIAHDLSFRDLRLPRREHLIKPHLDDVADFVQRASRADYCVLDIETPCEVRTETVPAKRQSTKCKNCGHPRKRHDDPEVMCTVKRCPCTRYVATVTMRRVQTIGDPYIGCIGYSFDPSWSFTVPLTRSYWHDQLPAVYDLLRRLHSSDVEWVTQNGVSFDAFFLAWHNLPLKNFRFDTRWMHVVLDPNLPHDLAFLGSIHTRQPYWKDEAKAPEEVMKYATNSEALWTYNGIDCCQTAEIFAGPRVEGCEKPLRERLTDEGRYDYYLGRYGRHVVPILGMALTGLRCDESRRVERSRSLVQDLVHLRTRIEEASGLPLIAKTGLSPLVLRYYLYGTKGVPPRSQVPMAEKWPTQALNLPVQWKRATKRGPRAITADEVTIRKLTLRYPEKLGIVGPLLLEYRRKQQVSQFVAEGKTDQDGRMRCAFAWASTMRLRSMETPRRTGRNLQNIDHEVRDIFVPG